MERMHIELENMDKQKQQIAAQEQKRIEEKEELSREADATPKQDMDRLERLLKLERRNENHNLCVFHD